MGDYILLKKTELLVYIMYETVVAEQRSMDEKTKQERLQASKDLRDSMKDFRDYLAEVTEELEKSYKNYRSNELAGYYSRFFGKIEGWFVLKILNHNKRKCERYAAIEKRITMKLTGIIYRLSI